MMTAPRIDDTLALPDGRRLGYAEYGDPDGEPGFYFHGHPGSRFEAQLADQAAKEKSIRIVALDRPGYGPFLSSVRRAAGHTHLPAATS
jgi:pimeloyl-ACP methyl ester carboxylesterase